VRTVSPAIWDAWNAGGPFIGDAAASHARVTVEPNWHLNMTGNIVGTYTKGPIRWWQRADNSQVEVEVPNIKRISTDRSIDTNAATCTITLMNQWMDENLQIGTAGDLGNPGYFTFDRGSTAEARARWGHAPNQWSDVIVPTALLRTYQGYGGKSKTITDAIDDGNLVMTGVWLIDEISVNAKGELSLRCRDMARLLVDMKVYPPVVPAGIPDGYPLRRCKWLNKTEFIQHPPQSIPSQDRNFRYGNCIGPSQASASDVYYGFNGAVYGHRPTHALDGNAGSYWLSVGNAYQNAPFAWEWLEVCTGGEEMDAVYIDPVIPDGGSYSVYISVWEGGGWVNGSGGALIDYRPAGIGLYYGANEARIPWVWKGSCSGPMEIRLPRKYAAQKYRITLTTLRDFSKIGVGGYAWRAGIRETRPRLAGYVVPGWLETRSWQEPGNYGDYVEVVKDLLLWGGWFLYESPVNGEPQVYGNLETTGAWAERGCLDEEFFDKKPLMDAINAIKEIVGYIFYVDEEGAVHFESPNWWASGNFNEQGQHTTFIPEIDETLQLTDYTVVAGSENLRTEIVISTNDPQDNMPGTITTRFRPESGELLRGIERPAMWVNDAFTDATEQRIMAELVAMQIFFNQRVGNVSAAANPAIQINDQVRIYERTTSETNTHYVRGITTEHD
jgi:hypothetical protein